MQISHDRDSRQIFSSNSAVNDKINPEQHTDPNPLTMNAISQVAGGSQNIEFLHHQLSSILSVDDELDDDKEKETVIVEKGLSAGTNEGENGKESEIFDSNDI